MRKATVLTLLAGALVLSIACSQKPLDEVGAEQSNTVAVRDSKFGPRVIEVDRGTTVTWRWQGKQPHNVSGEGWSSKTQESGEFQHTFAAAGVYNYKCALHEGMTGRVIVTESGNAAYSNN